MKEKVHVNVLRMVYFALFHSKMELWGTTSDGSIIIRENNFTNAALHDIATITYYAIVLHIFITL